MQQELIFGVNTVSQTVSTRCVDKDSAFGLDTGIHKTYSSLLGKLNMIAGGFVKSEASTY